MTTGKKHFNFERGRREFSKKLAIDFRKIEPVRHLIQESSMIKSMLLSPNDSGLKKQRFWERKIVAKLNLIFELNKTAQKILNDQQFAQQTKDHQLLLKTSSIIKKNDENLKIIVSHSRLLSNNLRANIFFVAQTSVAFWERKISQFLYSRQTIRFIFNTRRYISCVSQKTKP